MIFTTGPGDPEGPVALPDRTWLVVEGTADRGCVTHISADGKTKRAIAKTGLPNARNRGVGSSRQGRRAHRNRGKSAHECSFRIAGKKQIAVTEYEHGQLEV